MASVSVLWTIKSFVVGRVACLQSVTLNRSVVRHHHTISLTCLMCAGVGPRVGVVTLALF